MGNEDDQLQELIDATIEATRAEGKRIALLLSLREDLIDVQEVKRLTFSIDKKLDVVLSWIFAEQSGGRQELEKRLRDLREKTNGLTFPERKEKQQRMTLPQLRQALTDRFNEEELKTLCFDIGVDYDSLRGEGKAAKVRELVDQEQRHGRVGRLRQWLE